MDDDFFDQFTLLHWKAENRRLRAQTNDDEATTATTAPPTSPPAVAAAAETPPLECDDDAAATCCGNNLMPPSALSLVHEPSTATAINVGDDATATGGEQTADALASLEARRWERLYVETLYTIMHKLGADAPLTSSSRSVGPSLDELAAYAQRAFNASDAKHDELMRAAQEELVGFFVDVSVFTMGNNDAEFRLVCRRIATAFVRRQSHNINIILQYALTHN